ncbi:MAG: prolipoprotein diacylglyceryl transferase [Gammaproteobacteria bacterium]|nr:prolipoprotein diacylglyceryl transferase [Gammaproteobacteria bacterium]
MLTYPQLNPIALSIGPIKIYWYGLMYLAGFLIAWLLAKVRVKNFNLNWTSEQASDFIFYCAIGVILGGRIGYILFYGLSFLRTDPLFIFKVWQGGMSFHGGLIGVLIALGFFARKTHKSFLELIDFTAPLAPIGLALGRVANFINGELLGRITTQPWGMIFPNGGDLPRHPSQLYEAFLEGIVLFIVIWVYSMKPRPKGKVSGLFLLLYGVIRFSVEFFRAPDQQLGFIAFNWLTMGQLLSLPMILFGIILLILRTDT